MAEWIDNLEYNFKDFRIKDLKLRKQHSRFMDENLSERSTTIYPTLQVVMYLSRLKQS